MTDSALNSLNRQRLLGAPFDLVNMETSLDCVRAMLDSDACHAVFAVNPEKVIACQKDKSLAAALDDATLVIPDGIGIVLASRLLKMGNPGRVAGADLMPKICELAANRGKSVFFFGAKPGVVDAAAKILCERYPRLSIAGTSDGYVQEEHYDRLVDRINESGAAVLFVGLGSPRQELWVQAHRDRLETVRVCQGVGGTFDAICGDPPRAPGIVQRLYLEWLYRLITQPSRLMRQSALPRFVVQVVRRAISLR